MTVFGNALLALLAVSAAAADLPALVRAERARIETGEAGGGFVERDGARLYYRTWPAAGDAAAPRAVVVVVHGIGFEAGPYGKVAEALGPRGIEVRATDLRGHGLSDGRRGLLAPLDDLGADLAAVVARARAERPGASVFLWGESLGGLAALFAAARADCPLDGLILESPALSSHPSQIVGPQLAFAAVAGLLAPDHPTIPIADSFIEAATRDPEFVRLRRTDPLAQNRISPRYLWRYGIDAPRWPRVARRVRVPTLALIAGRDVIVRTSAVRAFVAADRTRRALIEYPEAAHTLLWDPETPRVLADAGDWILERAR